jgi:hypothetical protein
VLKEVCDAGLTERIICRTVAVPNHMGHDRDPMVRDHHHVKTVIESEARYVRGTTFRSPERRSIGPWEGFGGGVHHYSTLAESKHYVGLPTGIVQNIGQASGAAQLWSAAGAPADDEQTWLFGLPNTFQAKRGNPFA